MENIVVVNFDQLSDAVQGLTELERLHDAEAVTLRAAAIVERRPDGTWRTVDETEHPTFAGSVAGGVIGMALGALTGPLGPLLGGTAGFLAGELIDVTEDQASEIILESMIARVPPGTLALIADVEEPVPDTVDAVMEKIGGRVTRWPRADVEAEMQAAAEATESARREGRRILGRMKAKAGTT